MIITTCTGSYYKWGELFLRSFKITNDNNIPIHINGVWLSDKQIEIFKSIYPKLTITNRRFTDKWIAKEYGVTVEDVERCKERISKGFKHRCRFWMDFIVVDGRISWLVETMQDNKDASWWLHLDIDMMFRFPIQPLIDDILNHDVVCRFRPNRTFTRPNGKEPPDSMKIAGGMVGMRKENGLRFAEKWLEMINSKTWQDYAKSKNLPHGLMGRGEPWGQTALYYAYEYYKDEFTWKQIDEWWLMASCNVRNPIWCGHKKGRVMWRGKKHSIPSRVHLRNILFTELEDMEKDKKKKWMNSIELSPEKR